jgi:hypothetical protein
LRPRPDFAEERFFVAEPVALVRPPLVLRELPLRVLPAFFVPALRFAVEPPFPDVLADAFRLLLAFVLLPDADDLRDVELFPADAFRVFRDTPPLLGFARAPFSSLSLPPRPGMRSLSPLIFSPTEESFSPTASIVSSSFSLRSISKTSATGSTRDVAIPDP